ncbi:MAG: MlaD family protein [Bacteroidales bacterium]|jgi:phospholipid/cholesterol/gamma-HCH transport system substrate-binding protein|nr:MlaD family protein [Bacteroidales bacterium]
MKKFQSREIKIAIAAIFSALLLFFGVNYLKGKNIMKPANYYYINLTDVTGCSVSTPVYLNGFRVGLINEMVYNYNKLGNITIELSLDSDLKLPNGTYATLQSSLLGDASVMLHIDRTTAGLLPLGDTIPAENQTKSGLVTKVEDIVPQVEHLLPRIDTILWSLQVLLSDPALKQSLDNINQTTANLVHSSRQLTVILNRDVPAIANNLTTVSSDFTEVSSGLKQIDFKSTMNTLDQSVKNLEALTLALNNSNSSLGLLMKDRKLYDNLNNTVQSADSLMIDLKANPKRYVHFSIW